MVDQCANSPCTAIFRSLHKGKLFVFAPRENSPDDCQPRIIHVWLCETCSRTMKVAVVDEQVRVTPIRYPSAGANDQLNWKQMEAERELEAC
jgi:hypothetical protein